jgi:dTDP-4-dehydrorhamnose 3,5-epimerase
MTIEPTKIKDLIILQPTVYGDQRGYFFESFEKAWWKENFPTVEFIQDNESKSKKGVLRGLHFQLPPFEQAKLVRVIEGEVLDVAVDLRKDSPTYGQYDAVVLSGENKRQLFVPRGFAHGFLVLSEEAIFSYKVDNAYAPDHEAGIIWNDKQLAIDWKFKSDEITLSDKDAQLQQFSDFNSPF